MAVGNDINKFMLLTTLILYFLYIFIKLFIKLMYVCVCITLLHKMIFNSCIYYKKLFDKTVKYEIIE